MTHNVVDSVLQEVRATRSFEKAANKLTDCAQALTGCEAAMLRFAETSDEGSWIPAVVERGFGCRFLRDETLIGADECLCGRVCRGCPESSFPFFTPRGSFVWGRVATIADDYPVASLGNVRGRCIAEGFESVGIFPLLGPCGPIGCLHLADSAPDRFSKYAEVLEAICARAGVLLLGFSQKEREASLIRAVETALMPPDPPTVPGLDLAVSFTSATESAHLGGDFYDVFELAGGSVLLLVGDYTGHGIGAAGMAARARYAIADLVSGGQTSVECLLERANEALFDVLPSDRFVTLAASLYSSGGRLEAGLAGHPRPLLVGGEGEVEELILPPNRPLGLNEHLDASSGTTLLQSCQTLVLYTDGITESRHAEAFFGVEGMMQVCRHSCGGDLGSLVSDLCRLSADFHDPAIPPDDRLALAVRRKESRR